MIEFKPRRGFGLHNARESNHVIYSEVALAGNALEAFRTGELVPEYVLAELRENAAIEGAGALRYHRVGWTPSNSIA